MQFPDLDLFQAEETCDRGHPNQPGYYTQVQLIGVKYIKQKYNLCNVTMRKLVPNNNVFKDVQVGTKQISNFNTKYYHTTQYWHR